MVSILPELIIGPMLVGVATIAARRWGSQVGGLVSAFPAVVGPVLLITAQERGDLFTARAANGTLLGLVSLSAFVLVYARVALRVRWGWSVLAGWACAAAAASLAGWLGGGGSFPVGLLAAAVSLSLAYAAMPRSEPVLAMAPPATSDDLALRMVLTAVLVGSLATAAVLVGPQVGGLLAALPVLASVLAVFTHRREGSRAVVALLRGMVVGMTGFVGFCAVVAWLIVPLGTGTAFAAAVVTALTFQLLLLDRRPRQALSLLRP